MSQLSEIQYWGNSLGLLPTRLSLKDQDKYILLNGGAGDFCLQMKNLNEEDHYYHSAAWSSSTKNFVVFNDDKLSIFNWQKRKVESVRIELIEKNLANFYDYLLQTSAKSEQDIVPILVNIFKQLRNLTNEKKDGVEALNLLFLLLTSLEEPDITSIDTAKWGLAQMPPPAGFENYIEQFKVGVLGLKPQLELILRHSAGVLFQEAHKEASFFNKQLGIFSNTLSSEYEVNRVLYSSIHYTPLYVARTIVENSLNNLDLSKGSLKILDPACGSSEFLIEVLKQLKSRSYIGTVNITGWDSSDKAINTSIFLLTYEKREWKGNLNFEIKLVEDSLKENWDMDYDLILMNPPFVSWEIMKKGERESVSDTLKELVTGRPNQASAFLYKAIQSLRNDGIIGCVAPSSIFTLSSYSELRKTLYEIINFLLVGKLGNFVFESALTDISILVAQKSESKKSPIIVWAKNEKGATSDALRELRRFEKSIIPFVNRKNFSVYKSDKFPVNEENWKPISFKENEIIKKLEAMVFQETLVRIQDIFHVKMGIRTGNNSVFKISHEYLMSLPEGERKYFRPIIDNDAIEKGVINVKNYVWYPYSETEVLITTEAQLKETVNTYYTQILLPKKDKLSTRSRKNEGNWWLLSEPLSWLRKKDPKLVSTEFGKAGSFAVDVEGNLLVERGNGWIPKKTFKHLDSNYFYLAVFSSPFFDSLLSIYSKQLLSGWDLGKMCTKNIPIPSVFSGKIDRSNYISLVEIGKQISTGKLIHYGLLDELVTKNLYSITSL